MSNILAAIGVGQMEVIQKRVEKKREVFTWYQEELSGLNIEFMPEITHSYGNRWLTTLLFPHGTNINELASKLNESNCESRPLWKPMHLQPLFKTSKALTNGVSEELFERGLCLPSGTAMEKNDVRRVCTIIKGELLK
jgi:UDP-N-acetylbacillosamine transaminase